jgi:membrane protease YdiL (CAAX protease family)
MKPLADPAAEHRTKSQARRGLAIYFALLIPLSATFETLMIVSDVSWVWALMWVPAAASIVARLALREGFSDVSFRIGGRSGWNAVGFALIFPVIVGLIAYGTAWTTGLVQFSPRPMSLVAPLIGASTSPVLILVVNIAAAATVVTLYSALTAAGEEIGWRGYMLTRLICSGVPMPIFASGVIWGLWHVPLILGGVYLTGPPPLLAALLWMVVATSFSFVFARLRLETGSVWPAIALHAAWNGIIQAAFDPASSGETATLWVGESGILVALTMIAAAIISAPREGTVRARGP